MNDPQRKPPGKPDIPTVRPKALRGDDPDLPAPPRVPGEEPRTQALDLGDLEEIDALLDEAEQGLSEVSRFEQKDEPLQSGRPPEQPPRKLPTIGMFGPYHIVGRLALGGMAEILLAREDSEGAGSRYLVVKRILPEYEKDKAFVEMFLDEARVMMRLRHPNVTHVYKFGKEEGTHFIAMEWVNGASLGKLIRRARKTGGVPVAVACKIVANVAEALDHAHAAKGEDERPLGLVHRDVTPDNIMISYDGAVKLLDFGIAKAEARSHKTQAGVVKGKFAYMAPEQCRAKDLDHRVDVFALGVCLYESLTGRPLYRRETEFETMEAIVRGPVPKLADRLKNPPPELEAIIARCLAKKREDRFQSAGELQEALSRFIAKRDEVVTARRVKELMEKLFREEQRRGPMVDTTPFGSSFHFGSDVAEMSFSTGDGDALPDMPVPELPGLEVGLPAVPDNPAPGRPLGQGAGPGLVIPDLTGPPPASALGKDRRPAPTAPPSQGRPYSAVGTHSTQPTEKKGTSVVVGALVGVAALAAVGAGIYFALPHLMPAEETVEDTGPAATLTGTLIVNSEPEGAEVFVDGESHGPTPATIAELPTGSHQVRLELDGYQPSEGTQELRAGQTRSITQVMEPVAVPEGPVAMGRLTLTSTPPAVVFHDGEELGRTPLRNVELPAGLVALELETPDGERHRSGVMVRADDHSSTHLDLQ
ncbi:MAG: protein kinase [Myxococcota bacterium]|nr:protein kinase [Myxococcota bacterium]